jgi:hypothetical protein
MKLNVVLYEHLHACIHASIQRPNLLKRGSEKNGTERRYADDEKCPDTTVNFFMCMNCCNVGFGEGAQRVAVQLHLKVCPKQDGIDRVDKSPACNLLNVI